MKNEVVKNRYDFVVLFDVENGNPNGDPDTGMARVNPCTNKGIVTNQCIKRKIRNYVEMLKQDSEGYDIYIKQDTCLSTKDKAMCKKMFNIDNIENLKKVKSTDKDVDIKVKKYLCDNFYDIRTFGQAMSTLKKGGLNSKATQIKGAVQIVDAKSVDIIFNQELSITRCCVTREDEMLEKNNTMGKRCIVPYGLYSFKGHVDAFFAEENGFTEEDLELLWESIINMFEHDHSAARGSMVVRELIVFKHESKLGNCSSQKLFDMVKVNKKDGVVYPDSYDDYNVEIDESKIPDKVTMTRMI